MANKDPLWFHIEEAFAAIEKECIEARAAELVVQQLAAEKEIARSIAGGGAGVEPAPPTKSEARYARAVEIAKDTTFREKHAAGADLVGMRERIRARLGSLRNRLRVALPQNEELEVLFPLVVHADEMASAATRGAVERWEPMQGEYFDITDGGERFFTGMEQRFADERTHPLVFEMYYFCLQDGFTGKYTDPDAVELREHKARLAERIPREPIRFPDTRREQRRPELVSFPWWYYAVAGGVVLLVFVVLSAVAGA